MHVLSRRTRSFVPAFAFALGGLCSLPVFAQENEAATRAVAAMRTAAGAELQVSRSARTGLATFISAPTGRSIPVPDAGAVTPEARALSFVQTWGEAFGLRGRDEISITRANRDALGIDHVRMRQVRSGIPVTGGEVIVHLRGNQVLSANGKTLDRLDEVNLDPAATALDALSTARAYVTRRFNAPDAVLSEARLEIFNQGLLSGRDFPTRLAWFVEATGPRLREFIWIDAHSRIVLLSFSQLAEAKNRTVYNGNNTSTLPGTLMRSEGGAATGNSDADKAYQFAGDTYDYYFTNHGRDSFDNAGSEIRSTINHCEGACPYDNAFWNGQQMVYGAGYSQADDVVGHELTHAVTERSANLFYYMQSGALNESFSDIFGETIDLGNGTGNDGSGVRWQLGEDLSIGAIRNMSNPTLFGDPGKMSDGQFRCDIDPSNEDGGGVHTNSGVPNHAYALMVDGGTYNSVTVAGIGIAKAAKIQYRALTQYLTSASDFLDNYVALQQSCADLVGTAGITAGNCTEVSKALNAVEMANTWPCAPLQALTPALCPAGQNAVDVFYDNFESGLGNWSISGPVGWWYRASDSSNPLGGTAYATSGVDSLWGYDRDSAADARIGLSGNLPTIPAGARLQFNHSFGFDSDSRTFDGGMVEYSTNGGGTWSDASGLLTAGAAYNGTIINGFGNPLFGRSAFVKDSFGYTASQYSLASLTGQGSVRFRFRMGTDTSPGFDDYGWFIDDFRVYQCVAPPPPTVITGAATAVSASGATLNGSVNPNGVSTVAAFNYGLTTGYGTQVAAAPSPGAGSAPVSVSAVLAGLSCNTTYHFRATASSSSGTTNGGDATFTTSPCPPSVTTNAAFNVLASTADVSGNVSSDGGLTILERGFVFSVASTNSNPGIGGPGVTKVVVAGTLGSFSTTLSPLANLTTYTFKAYATNSTGTGYGTALIFSTLGPPSLAAATSANVSPTSADVASSVTSDGGAVVTERGFVYSTASANPDPLIGGVSVTKVVIAGTTGPFSSTLSSLTPSTGYALKAYAINTFGTSYSALAGFTTSDPPAPEALVARTLGLNSVSQSTLSNALPQIWYRVRLFANRSYEVSAWPVDHEQGVDAATLSVAIFSDDTGIVQANGVTGGSGALEATSNQGGDSKPFTAVIQPAVTGVYKIRVKATSGGTVAAPVNLRLRETTLFSPWTSRAAGFEGFMEMHNNTNAPIIVTLRGFDLNGALQGAGLTFTLQPNATDYRTATQIGVPVDVFAGIVLTHDGAFGGVSANITTLNGANGLSFDSPFTSRDRGLQGSPLR